MVLHAGLALGRAGGVDSPRVHGVDRLAHVRRAETAGEHDAAFGRPGALDVGRILRAPGQVDDGRDRLVAPEQHAVAGAMTVVARVELDDVGARLVHLADEHGDAEDRVGRAE